MTLRHLRASSEYNCRLFDLPLRLYLARGQYTRMELNEMANFTNCGGLVSSHCSLTGSAHAPLKDQSIKCYVVVHILQM
jgi:hypothetical protein